MIIEFFLLENKMDICLGCCNAVNKKDLYPTTRIQVLKMIFTDGSFYRISGDDSL